VTQRNASGSEELASTAEEMASQAEALQQLTGFFKLDGAGEMQRQAHAPLAHAFTPQVVAHTDVHVPVPRKVNGPTHETPGHHDRDFKHF